MPDLKLPRAVTVAFSVIVTLIGALVLLLALMTFPPIGTPVTNMALGVAGPDGASVSRAHTRFSSLNTVVFQGLEADRAEISSGSVRLNFLGFLPRVAWISRAEARDGFIAVERGQDRDEGITIPQVRRLIDEVALTDIDVRYTRRGETNVISISEASGSLRAGSVQLKAAGGRSELEFAGSAEASTLNALAGQLRLRGENFADFAWVAGFAAPNTPPYDAVADIRIERNLWTIDFQPDTRIGDSDLAGPLTIRTGQDTPMIEADLRSANLDFDDLGILFGIPIGVGADETANEEQAEARAALDASGRLIPDATIDFTRLDAVDGTIRFAADEVSDAIFDIRGLKLEFEIEGRVVRAPVLELSFAEGQLAAYVTLDGSQSPAMTTAEGELTGVPFNNLAADPYVRGTAYGEFKLEGRGDGFRDTAATLDGRVSLWSQNAQLLALVAEASALDIPNTLALLDENEGEQTYAPTSCAVASLALQEGVGRADPVLFDTEKRLVVVTGDVNLGNETIDLSVQSDSKDPSFATLAVDVKVGGTFRSPELSALGPETVLQIGAAAVLGSITGGLAALPFIELGEASDAPCADIVARAEQTRE
ncbi:AsmA family protein [Hyphomonas polymorpha PS728]|uniref:AsmA family protein n=1 Tax=Hyphomonas polymorpha PS728 TaxID=1280954 RepID=A0A062VD33_9PROT|nr:AsmA family protein [Hyphomonas polymorpha]KDA00445.1 AsmA family protein [Hyphomonas polymorpha PS728]